MRTVDAVTTVGTTRAGDYVTLAKPRLNLLVVGSTMVGYVMGGGRMSDVPLAALTFIGTALVAAGASAFNQVLEREPDAQMRRTRMRPLADGRLNPFEGLTFASLLSAAGLVLLATGVNLLSAGVAAATLVTYAAVYTPLKPMTAFATVIGAIPGALPPVIGWAAAQDALAPGAWILFSIVFLWQLPHFLAIAWMYREDYARAGFRMLPVIEPDGRSTARQSVAYAAALLPMSLAPTLAGLTTTTYLVGAFALSCLFVVLAMRFAMTRSVPDARRLFLGSITYLPLLWILMVTSRPGWSAGISISDLPAINASLNGISAILLVIGYTLIRRRRIEQHRRVMIAAFATSTLFLITYLIYHANVGARPFPGQGAIRQVYFAVLISHAVLAATVPPLALITLVRGLRERYDKHRTIARWTLPIWLYVSVTGVIVYLMLYQMY
jgi:protoheme IX farnesyltransferase